MLAQEVAKKYAGALFLASKEKGLLDTAAEQFESLGELITRDRTLLSFLSAPHVLDENKHSVVRDVFGPRMDRLFVEFLLVLIEKGRVGFLPEVIDEFTRMFEAEKGLGRITAITAVRLDETERADVIRRMAAKTGLKVILEEKVDPSILGGMILILHNEIIDGSVRRGLDLVANELTKVRVH
jgi:F-type H+-transporting ATPase subunit delta